MLSRTFSGVQLVGEPSPPIRPTNGVRAYFKGEDGEEAELIAVEWVSAGTAYVAPASSVLFLVDDDVEE